MWPKIVDCLNEGDALYFSHGFSRRLQGPDRRRAAGGRGCGPGCAQGLGHAACAATSSTAAGINASFAVQQDATGRARERTLALGIAIGSGYLFPTTFQNEVYSDLTGERGVLMGALAGVMEAQYNVLRKHGHSPSEAFNETVEELTQSLIRLVARTAWTGCTPTARPPPSAARWIGTARVPRGRRAGVRRPVRKRRDRRTKPASCSKPTAAPITARSSKRNCKKCANPKCGRRARRCARCARKIGRSRRNVTVITLTLLETIMHEQLRPNFRHHPARRRAIAGRDDDLALKSWKWPARWRAWAWISSKPASRPPRRMTWKLCARIAVEVGNPPDGEPNAPVICGLARATKSDIDKAWEAVQHAQPSRASTPSWPRPKST